MGLMKWNRKEQKISTYILCREVVYKFTFFFTGLPSQEHLLLQGIC